MILPRASTHLNPAVCTVLPSWRMKIYITRSVSAQRVLNKCYSNAAFHTGVCAVKKASLDQLILITPKL